MLMCNKNDKYSKGLFSVHIGSIQSIQSSSVLFNPFYPLKFYLVQFGLFSPIRSNSVHSFHKRDISDYNLQFFFCTHTPLSFTRYFQLMSLSVSHSLIFQQLNCFLCLWSKCYGWNTLVICFNFHGLVVMCWMKLVFFLVATTELLMALLFYKFQELSLWF